MGYERYPRSSGYRDEGRDHRSDRDDRYRTSGERHRDERASDRTPYGQREYGYAGYAQRDRGAVGQSGYGGQSAYGGHGGYEQHDDGRGAFRGSPDGARRDPSRDRDYGRQPQGYDYDDRGFFARAGDEVRSWFGDDEAERRREADTRYDERSYGARASSDRDSDYHNWRSGQIAALDRDYDEYRREHRSKFDNEFSTWRTTRQGQRDQMGKAEEHMEVVGSDGSHVGTVDKVRGDRLILTKNDADAGGRHHSIPCDWIQSVDTKVTLSKTADEAKRHWRDEERNQALFGDEPSDGRDTPRDPQGRILNRSFSGTY